MKHNNSNDFTTNAIRYGYNRTQEQEHSEAIFLTSSFVFDSAEQAKKRFAKEEQGNIYSRFTNPTVRAFEKRLAILECGEDAQATASGMSAIFATIMALLQAGDHIVASRNMFGSTIVLLNTIVSKFAIDISFVDLADIKQWQDSIKSNTKLFLLETPSNPLGDIVPISKLAKIAKNNNILLAVDNICTPVVQQPLKLGADIIIHSATKYIDGQGRTLAGAVIANKDIIDKVHNFVRTTGPSLSSFNAWVCLKGLETLALRMKAHCNNAMLLANWLVKQNTITKVYYLGLKEHPYHSLAKQQQYDFGAIVAFVVKGGQKLAFNVINNTKLISITANLGDTKTTITHPATTTHSRLSDTEKQQANISPGLIRISVGLESIDDIIADINRGLNNY